jgi:uncharacterized protein (DUF1800 family)
MKLAESFQSTGGDIKAMLRPMLLSEEMRGARPIYKRPFDFLVSSVRAFGGSMDGGKAVQEHLEKMGQPLFQWPMPDGYPDKTAAWTGSMLSRWNYALALATSEIPGAYLDLDRLPSRTNGERVQSVAKLALPHSKITPSMEKALARCNGPAEAAALCLCSAEFQWR